MNQAIIQEEWLKVLGKGLVTLPKKWRKELGIETGDIIKAKKEKGRVIIEPQKNIQAPYRLYTDEEIVEFLARDTLSPAIAKKIQSHLKAQAR